MRFANRCAGSHHEKPAGLVSRVGHDFQCDLLLVFVKLPPSRAELKAGLPAGHVECECGALKNSSVRMSQLIVGVLPVLKRAFTESYPLARHEPRCLFKYIQDAPP